MERTLLALVTRFIKSLNPSFVTPLLQHETDFSLPVFSMACPS
jgi:hypothetical protein